MNPRFEMGHARVLREGGGGGCKTVADPKILLSFLSNKELALCIQNIF
jgi:hypothetical protein